MRMSISEFVRQHKHIQYCEVVIYPNGEIEYIDPSHTYHLLRLIFGDAVLVNEDDPYRVWSLIPEQYEALEWLVYKTGCCAVWYNKVMMPTNATTEQKLAMHVLKLHKAICRKAEVESVDIAV